MSPRNGGDDNFVFEWKFFFGACLLTGALLLPLGPSTPITAGMILAGLVIWLCWWFVRHRDHAPH